MPPAISALVLLIGGPRFSDYIEKQLVAASLFTLTSVGLSVTLASLPLPATMRMPTFALAVAAGTLIVGPPVATILGNADLATSLAIAGVMLLNILYRIPGWLFASRGILLLQFLPLLSFPGTFALYLSFLALMAHLLWIARAKSATLPLLHWKLLGGAFLVSVSKDQFFRGHYLPLAAVGLADSGYALILRFIDLVSRPSDYLFQRLVDTRRIGRNRYRILAGVPAVFFVSFGLAHAPQDFSGYSTASLALVGLTSSLVVLVKYLSFNANAHLRFLALSTVYLGSLIFALPSLLLVSTPAYPLIFAIIALAIAAVALTFILRQSQPATMDKSMNELESS